MKMIKPLLIASALLVSSTSFARDMVQNYCTSSKATVNGYNLVLTPTCQLTANKKPCGVYRNMTTASQVTSVTMQGNTCRVTYK